MPRELFDRNSTCYLALGPITPGQDIQSSWALSCKDAAKAFAGTPSVGLSVLLGLGGRGIHHFAPGAFTAILSGKNGGTGIGLVEVYNIQ